MKKPAIPNIAPQAANAYSVLQALRTNVEILTGTRGGAIQPLPATASQDDVIRKVNEIIERLMGR